MIHEVTEIPALPKRSDEAHKGDLGRLVIVGGSVGDVTMIGAPALVANAAFRSGVGLVQVLIPREIRAAVATLAPCATLRTLPTDADGLIEATESYHAEVAAVGPGLGRSLTAKVLVEFLRQFPGPVVVDADGLNLLAEAPPFSVPDSRRIVLTPHPGEMRKLLKAREKPHEVGTTRESRSAAALALADTFDCVAVLKGAGTIVTDGRRLYVNTTGNSGMATAGTGDVLTGVISALIGQKMGPFEAAVLGVYLHGLAGDLAAAELGRHSMMATDIVDYLPEAFSADAD